MPGRVIGVDLSMTKSRRIEFDEVPGPWALLLDRLRGLRNRRYRLPTLASYLMNVSVLYSTSRQRQAQRLTDLYFNAPLDRVGMLQWNRLDDIARQGYQHALEVLGALGGDDRQRLGLSRRASGGGSRPPARQGSLHATVRQACGRWAVRRQSCSMVT